MAPKKVKISTNSHLHCFCGGNFCCACFSPKPELVSALHQVKSAVTEIPGINGVTISDRKIPNRVHVTFVVDDPNNLPEKLKEVENVARKTFSTNWHFSYIGNNISDTY